MCTIPWYVASLTQLAGSDTVKAQIRLRFRNTHGVRMSCVRNLQVSKKRGGGLTMKTLEGVLGVDDAEAESAHATISTRCAELDQEMSLLLGVSPAIIESVLFCHQEESNWPLSEPAALKKRFDDIFEVTRYTKALDALKALRKQRLQDARVDDAELRALQQEKERADATQRTIHTLAATLAEKTAELDALDADVANKTAENKALYDAALEFRDVIGQAEALEERLALYAENRDALAASTTLLDASEGALETQLGTLPAQLAEKRERLDEIYATLAAEKEERAAAAAEHERLLQQHGEQLAARRALERTLGAARDDLVATAARYGFDAQPTDTLDDVYTLCDAVQAQLAAHVRAADAEDARRDREATERDTELEQAWQHQRSALRDLHAQYAQQTQTLDRLQERIAACDREMQGGAPAVHSDRLAALREKHAALTSAHSQGSAEPRRAQLADEIHALERRRDALSKSAMASNQTVEQRALLAQNEQTLQKDTAALDELYVARLTQTRHARPRRRAAARGAASSGARRARRVGCRRARGHGGQGGGGRVRAPARARPPRRLARDARGARHRRAARVHGPRASTDAQPRRRAADGARRGADPAGLARRARARRRVLCADPHAGPREARVHRLQPRHPRRRYACV